MSILHVPLYIPLYVCLQDNPYIQPTVNGADLSSLAVLLVYRQAFQALVSLP